MQQIQARTRRFSFKSLKSKAFVESVLTTLSLAFIFVLAVFARITPAKYAFQIAEVDPYWYYYTSYYMLTHGVSAWFHWVNYMEFYPYGLNIPKAESPMLSFTSVFLYQFVRAIGINISFYDFAVALPVVFTSISTIFMYYLGKEIGGKKTGILAALFLALSPANIQQTMLGDFKQEFLAFFFMVPALYFLLRSFRTKSSLDMLISGVFLSCAVASWDPVSPYYYDMVALVVFIGVLTRKLSPNSALRILAFVDAPALLVSTMIARDVGPVTHLSQESPVFGAFLVALLMRVYDFLGEQGKKTFKATIVPFVIAIVVLMGFLIRSSTGGRILAIIDPFYRSSIPIVNTVAENELTTWFDFYAGFNIQMLLLPVAIYLFFRRSDMAGVAMILFALSATYATASYVRAEEILTPIAAVAAAYVISRLIDAYAPILIRAYRSTAKGRRSLSGVDWEVGGILLIALIITSGFFMYQGLAAADSPPLLMTVGGHVSSDWEQALLWIRYNTPPNAVVASWWDYGYWIMVIANRPTLADPSTVNTTQIQYLAIALMANYTISEKILSFYHAQYLLIYQPIGYLRGGLSYPTSDGDLGKSGAMLTIAASTNFKKFEQVFGFNLTPQMFNQSYYLTQLPNFGLLVPSGKYASQATLYNLMFGSNPSLQYSLQQLGQYSGVTIPSFQVPPGFKLVYSTPDQAILVYELNTTSSL